MISTQLEVRRSKLELLLAQLKRGEPVHNRELKTWLGEQTFAEYCRECAEQCELRKELREKPLAVKEYEQRLKRALFVYNKAEGAGAKGRRDAAKNFYAQAEQLFERSLEYLQEQMADDPSLCIWFDRDTEWRAGGDVGIDPITVPRVVTSRSLDNRGGGILMRLMSKTELKIAAMERAIVEIDDARSEAITAETEQGQQRLRRFLAMKSEDL